MVFGNYSSLSLTNSHIASANSVILLVNITSYCLGRVGFVGSYYCLLFVTVIHIKRITCVLRKAHLIKWNCFPKVSKLFYQLIYHATDVLMEVCLLYLTIIKCYFSTFSPSEYICRICLSSCLQKVVHPGYDSQKGACVM